MTEQIEKLAKGLCDMELEWITGWQGPRGAAFNVIATQLVRKGILRGPMDWTLSETGLALRAHLAKENGHD